MALRTLMAVATHIKIQETHMLSSKNNTTAMAGRFWHRTAAATTMMIPNVVAVKAVMVCSDVLSTVVVVKR